MTARRTTPPSVDWVLRKLDRSIRTMQSIRRGFHQQGESLAALRMLDKIDTLQALREVAFGLKLRDYSANRNLFPRPRRRRKDTPR